MHIYISSIRISALNVYSFILCCSENAYVTLNPLNTKLSPICYLLALLGVHHFLHVSRIRVKRYT